MDAPRSSPQGHTIEDQMTKLRSALCAALALSFAAGTAVPLSAAPLPAPRLLQETARTGDSSVTDVQYRRERRGYYRGHRGYRNKRPGYRYRNGYWFPPAAFIAGAIIGGALNDRSSVRVSDRHIRWCANRYRSYRASDNSYKPNRGPRRSCNSPYN